MRRYMIMSIVLLFVSTVSFTGFKGKWVASRMEEIQEAAESIQDSAQVDTVKQKAQMIHDKANDVYVEAKYHQKSERIKSKARDNRKLKQQKKHHLKTTSV